MRTKHPSFAELEQLAKEHNQKLYPSTPEHARPITRYQDGSANNMTKCIIDFLRFKGFQAERINTTGTYRPGKTVVDVLGRNRTFGGKYTRSGITRGSADISAVIQGKAVKIEVKHGRDKMSEEQERYRESIEAAGGIYYTAKNYPAFREWMREKFGV